ncbi:ubiquitin-conjugating enzyme E2-binding protein [Phlyctochytrium arcticum]|nr:ubiquitin-conjugating enzyme E2-binding protein [Phlyctochytrium arcticum]
MSSTNPPPPVVAFLELLPNISSLTVSISAHPSFKASIAEKNFVIERKAVVFRHESIAQPYSIPLPVEVNTQEVLKSRSKDGTIDIKLSVRSKLPQLDARYSGRDGVNELKGLDQIQCHQCTQELLPKKQSGGEPSHTRFARIMDMPSEYWHELTDCWACHREDYSQLPGQKGGVILAQPQALLVARNYIILHPHQVDMDAIHVDLSKASKSVLRLGRWAPASCAKCSASLGECLFDEFPTNPSQVAGHVQAVKIFKYWANLVVQSSPPGKSDQTVIHRPFLGYFTDDLIDSADAHASYQFLMTIPGSDAPQMLVWVLNANLGMAASLPRSAAGLDSTAEDIFQTYASVIQYNGTSKLLPAMKVLYLDCRVPASLTPFQQRMMDTPALDTMTLQPELLEQVARGMQIGAELLLPPDQGKRTLNGYHVGVLLRGV